jgi:hypothetical protein
MQNDILASLARLSDAELVTRLKGLVTGERDTTAQIVAHLAEMDTRDVHLREGYSSLYTYCRGVLRLSEWEAYNRIEVARAARRFPVILHLLADGAIHLTGVKLVAPHLTPANHREVLESARGKSKVEVEEIVARLSPKPDVPTSVRRVSTPRVGDQVPAIPALFREPPAEATSGRVASPPAAASAFTPPRSAAAVTPLSPERYKLQLTIAGDTLEKLRLAKDMLGHAIPSGDDAAVLDRALTLLLADLARKKFAETARPCPPREIKPGVREPSAHVKRAVWVRDLGRCAFVGTNRHRCNERRFMEFHHTDPYVLGGEATVDQIELRCRRHNDYEGRLWFGRRRRGGDAGAERKDPSPIAANGSFSPELVPEQVQSRALDSTV